MNIVMFSRRYSPHVGGVESHVGKLSEEIIKAGHNIKVITEEKSSTRASKEIINKVMVYRIPLYGVDENQKKWLIWKWLWKNRYIWQDADILHIHDVFYWMLPFRVLGMTSRIYTTFHGWEGIYPPTRSARLQKQLAQVLSNGTIAVGDYIGKWYGIKPNYVVYGGTDQKELKETKSNNILVLGRLSEDNDIDIVLSGLKNMGTKAKIVFVGDGEYRIECEKIGTVTGMVNDISPYLGRAKIVITSSYLSILNSLGAGRSVVSVYGNPLKKDYLMRSPFGQLIEVAADAKELSMVLSNKFKKQLLINGQFWAEKQTWSKIANTYLNLWK